MPYPNEHTLRLKSPSSFASDTYRRTHGSGKGKVQGVKIPSSIDVIWAKLKGKSSASDPVIAQALRFPISKWGKKADRAKKWISDHGIKGTFEAAAPKKNESEYEELIKNCAVINTDELKFIPIIEFRVNLKPLEYDYHTWNGIEYLVVPATIIVEGVHNGYLYPAEELKNSVDIWEGLLVPIYHPHDGTGNFVSAEEVKDECVGRFWNPVWDEEKKGIKGEFWLEVEKLTGDLIEEIINGNMEVSTGLFAMHDFSEGEWHGEKYKGILSEYEGDHVALLPGKIGACSWEDGCGIRVNFRQGTEVQDCFGSNSNSDEQTVVVHRVRVNNEESEEVINITEKNEFTPTSVKIVRQTKGEGEGALQNELSFEDIRMTLQGLLREGYKTPQNEWPNVYVRDTFKDHFIFESEGKLYKQGYKVDSEDMITFEGNVKEVRLKSEYEELEAMYEEVSKEEVNSEEEQSSESEKETKTNDKEVVGMKKEDKDRIINSLIANEDFQFGEEKREWLEAQDDSILESFEKMYPEKNASEEEEDEGKQNSSESETNEDKDKKKEKETPPAVNTQEENKEKSLEEYLNDKTIPKEVRNVVEEKINERKARKDSLIKTIMENKGNKFTKEQLEAKEPEELSLIVSFIKENEEEKPSFLGSIGAMFKKTPAPNEKQEDGSGVPDPSVPVWNKDGSPDFSQLSESPAK